MDSLLPSEIARLVLGYLQEQKCEGAAKTFLETFPLLQECHLVAQRGGKYSTKVGGLSLIDILEKYCAVNSMVQEKLSRVTDSETLKQCNDLLDQLRYLLEGSSTRGHRFVVNISVPSQSSPSGPFGSPIVSGSSRKRHHSNSERGKRVSKSLCNLLDKNAQNAVNPRCDTVEATPLESLPGHKTSTKQSDSDNQINTNSNHLYKADSMMPAPKISPFDVPSSSTITMHHDESNLVLPSKANVHSIYKDQDTDSIPVIAPVQTPSKCTAGTNTDELMNYCSAEVQTAPSDIIESESDINDEPVENLSILTKKLLQRTELHERIAENINKAIMPVETTLRVENACENPNEANVSILNDFDTTIKSIVQATETDPVFEDFIKEIFKVGETDTSPDEDSDSKNNQISNDGIYPQYDNIMLGDNNCEIVNPMKLNEQKTDGSEVPLKHRLRSSSRSQNPNIDDEEKDTNSILENQNAEAIMSIVNVVNSKRNSLTSIEEPSKEVPSDERLVENPVVYEPLPEVRVEPEVKKAEEKIKPHKSTVKKPKKPKPPKPPPPPEPEPEVVPTLILCTKNEVESMIHHQDKPSYIPIAPKPMDKTPPPVKESSSKIFLRTVNVPRHLVNPATVELSKAANPQILQIIQQQQQQQQQQVGSPEKTVGEGGSIVSSATSDQIVVPIVVTDEKQLINDGNLTSTTTAAAAAATALTPISCVPSSESITLYGGGGDVTSEMKVSPISSMPIISLDDSSIGLTAGTGLSPFFKDHVIGGDSMEAESAKKNGLKDAELMEERKSATESKEAIADTTMDTEDDCPEPVVLEVEPDEEELAARTLKVKLEEKKESAKSEKTSTTEIIAKRTPKTLLRSRAKNNRLSLSTPRRRNSHVRALDFNTPTKDGTAKKVPQSCTRSKSVCRAGLFKSPPFTGATPNVNINLQSETQPVVKKVRTISPIKPIMYTQVPIATRSPVPKLQGNWAKYTGIGMILGETSTSESSPDKTPQPETRSIPSPIPEVPEESITEVPEEKSEDNCMKNVEKPIEKKSWDSDLRKIVGAQVTEEENKPRTRSSKRASSRRKGSSAKTTESNVDDSAATKTKDPKDNARDKKKSKDVKKIESEGKIIKKSDDDNAKEGIDKNNTSVEAGIDTAHKTEITPPSAPSISKKSQLEPLNASKLDVENDKNVKNSNIPKNSPINITITRFPDMLDLETPRKTEVALYVPPTPRLLVTPGDSLKMNRSKTDLRIKECVDTPEFPMTPCIVVTPKIVEEEDDEKRPSPYYEPEEDDPSQFKEIVTEKVVMQVQETTTVTIQKNVIELQENKSIEITEYGIVEENMNQNIQEEQITSGNSSKEVVEESSIEGANTSANSSANSYSDSDDDSSDSDSSTSSTSSDSSTSSTSSGSSAASSPTKSVIQDSAIPSQSSPETSPTKSAVHKNVDVDPQSSSESSPTKSVTQAASETTAQSSSESSTTSIAQETIDVGSQSFRKDLSMTDSETDSPERPMQSCSKASREELDRLEAESRENSPTKVFSVTKEPADEEVKETPAKSENMIEAMIGETPSVTSAERALRRDSLTNLTSKISAIITTSQSDQSSVTGVATYVPVTLEESSVTSTVKSGPKIKSIELIASNDMTKKVSEMLQMEIKNHRSTVTQRNTVVNHVAMDAKLSQQLEEKRLRMLAKLNGHKNPKIPGKGKKPSATKKNADAEKVVSSTTDNRKGKIKEETESDKLVCNIAKNTDKSKSDNVKLSNKKNEEVKESKKNKGKTSPRKKTAQNDQQGKTENASKENNLKKTDKELTQNTAKETSTAANPITITVENVKGISKSKVDQVKRDLFSDDEIQDQRTTRSQTARRNFNDGQKDSNMDNCKQANTSPEGPLKEKLPGVLECLQLIPANKNDQESHDFNDEIDDSFEFNNSQTNSLDINIVHDESVPIKKRTRKYSISELQSQYTFTEEDGQSHILTPIDEFELFKMTPKSVKPKSSASPKKTPTKVKKSCIKIIEKPPLACSSPIAASNSRGVKPDEKKKKICKRKTSPNKEDRLDEKKIKVDPLALLNKIKVDEFLKLVHE